MILQIQNQRDIYNSLEQSNLLHNKNLKGGGLVIAVLDAGFSKANQMDAFEKLFSENRILGTRDFVKKDNDVFQEWLEKAKEEERKAP